MCRDKAEYYKLYDGVGGSEETPGSVNHMQVPNQNIRIKYIHEPTDLQCGQAVLAMLTGIPPKLVASELGNERETTLREMRSFLRGHGIWMADQRIQITGKEELPATCLLSLETPRCWHWSLYCDGVFYDPEHGIMDDFPESARRYCWKIKF